MYQSYGSCGGTRKSRDSEKSNDIFGVWYSIPCNRPKALILSKQHAKVSITENYICINYFLCTQGLVTSVNIKCTTQ
jgi:hypothetical protein